MASLILLRDFHCSQSWTTGEIQNTAQFWRNPHYKYADIPELIRIPNITCLLVHCKCDITIITCSLVIIHYLFLWWDGRLPVRQKKGSKFVAPRETTHLLIMNNECGEIKTLCPDWHNASLLCASSLQCVHMHLPKIYVSKQPSFLTATTTTLSSFESMCLAC